MKSILNLILIILATPALSLAWSLEKGTLNGQTWNSDSLKDKVYVLFYVSPRHKELNNETSEALKEQKFNSKSFQSVAIVDLKSSWLPNSLITGAIKKKQKKYPRTIYLKDKNKSFPSVLKFEESGNDVFAFDKNGNEIFRHIGKLESQDTQNLLEIIRKNIAL